MFKPPGGRLQGYVNLTTLGQLNGILLEFPVGLAILRWIKCGLESLTFFSDCWLSTYTFALLCTTLIA